jgi:hypothetical protein
MFVNHRGYNNVTGTLPQAIKRIGMFVWVFPEFQLEIESGMGGPKLQRRVLYGYEGCP